MVFDPSSRYLAILGIRPTGFVNLESADWVSKPDAPDGHVETYAEVFAPSSDTAVYAIDASAPRGRVCGQRLRRAARLSNMRWLSSIRPKKPS